MDNLGGPGGREGGRGRGGREGGNGSNNTDDTGIIINLSKEKREGEGRKKKIYQVK